MLANSIFEIKNKSIFFKKSNLDSYDAGDDRASLFSVPLIRIKKKIKKLKKNSYLLANLYSSLRFIE